jgi:transcription termination factor NusB
MTTDMGKRREARERAVQFLFQQEVNPADDLAAALDQFWNSQREAARAEDAAPSTWGERKVELPPPTAAEAADATFLPTRSSGARSQHREASGCDSILQKYRQKLGSATASPPWTGT